MIQVSFTFDPSGFSAYEDINDPACRQNLMELFHGFVADRHEAKAEALEIENTAIREPYLKSVEQDIILAKKIFDSIQIQEIK